MIEYLQLRNFQSHKNSELEFCPGVNVIVGESDQGKTAIMRALYWLIFGKPSGDSMRRHNIVSDTEVIIETKEHVISRIRGTNTNQYVINEEVLKGFGQGVPEPVVRALNINEINFMRQMDPPFLFSKTAGEVAQYLNRLINLDVIDTSLSNIKRMHSQANSKAEGHFRNTQNIQNALEAFDWIDDAEKEIEKLEKKERKIQKLRQAFDSLYDAANDYDNYLQVVEELSYVKQLSATVDKLIDKKAAIEIKTTQYKTLRNALSRAETAQRELGGLPNTKGAEKAILAIETQLAKCKAKQVRHTELKNAVGNARAKSAVLQKLLAEQKQLTVYLNKVMPNICPLCEQPIRRKN